MAYARELSKDLEKEEIEFWYKMREKSCPVEYTDILDEKLEWKRSRRRRFWLIR